MNISEILEEIIDLDPEAREEFLIGLDADAAMVEEVRRLMSSVPFDSGIFDRSPVNVLAAYLEDEESTHLRTRKIGKYSVIREIGHGGMGSVYLADRTDGRVEQRVAIKLLRRELSTSTLRKRFEFEKEILSSLEHPNIARLLDAGETDDGVPFLVLEYIEGVPIHEYCSTRQLTVVERIRLFRKVLSAVEFAHRNLVVHRDIKPENILVDKLGEPKLLDFGISRIVTEDSDDPQTITKLGAMTPGYASPEQLEGKRVTVSSDVFSLGVVLFEILTGRKPFDAIQIGNLKALLEFVSSEKRVRPSAALLSPSLTRTVGGEAHDKIAEKTAGAPNAGNTSPAPNRDTVSNEDLVKQIRGDLDNIVLKAIEADTDRRYASAKEFSDDLGRFLNNEPIIARPNTFGYRFRKLAERNKFAFAMTALFAIAATIGLMAFVWQAELARREGNLAQRRFNDLRKLAYSNIDEVYPEVEKLEGSLKARQAIVTRALEYLDKLESESNGDTGLQRELASAYERISEVQGRFGGDAFGDVKQSTISLEKALALRERVLATEPDNALFKSELAQNLGQMAAILWNQSKSEEAGRTYQRAVDLARGALASDTASAKKLSALGDLLVQQSKVPEFNKETAKALPILEEGIEKLRKASALEPKNVDYKQSIARALGILSGVLQDAGRTENALAALKEAKILANDVAAAVPNDFKIQRGTWLSQYRLCEFYINTDNVRMSAQACVEAVEFPEKHYRKEPANTRLLNDLAVSYFNAARGARVSKRPAEGIPYATKALEMVERQLASEPDNKEMQRIKATYLTENGRLFELLNQVDSAIGKYEAADRILSSIANSDPKNQTLKFDIGLQNRLLGTLLAAKGNKAEALIRLKKTLALYTELKNAGALTKDEEGLPASVQKQISDLEH
ncbi:MAG: protein kinase [Pyrinomonadaceae bacterium]